METMNVKDFYYDLPQELIAQDPLKDRSASRLLVMHRDTGALEHRVFKDIVDYLRPGDCLVINDTKVIPARLFGVKADTGAKIEVLLLKRREKMQTRHGDRFRGRAAAGNRHRCGGGRQPPDSFFL